MSSRPSPFRPAGLAQVARRAAFALVVATGAALVAPAVHGDLAAQAATAKVASDFASVRGMVDALSKSGGLGPVRADAVMHSLDAAEKSNGAGRINALRAIAESLKADQDKSVDAKGVRALRQAILNLANAR